jgi:16S rRNA processing protein RimM
LETRYFKIGKIVAVFGLNGEMILQHSLGKKNTFKGVQAIFIEHPKNTFLPYFVEDGRIKSDQETYVKIEAVHSREDARKLVQKEIWLAAEDFEKCAGKSSPISVLGYHVIHNDEDLGEINEVIEQPHQLLCSISLHGKEVLIPLHQETLKKIDNKAKKIYVILPDGLLDI